MASDFTTSDLDKVKPLLEEYGVAIVPSILNESECKTMNDGMWDSVEKLTLNQVKRDDPKTWKNWFDTLPKHGMLQQHFGVGQAQYVWDVRSNAKVAEVFAKIWETKEQDLLCSFDGVSWHFPPEETGRAWFRNEGWHCDQSFKRHGFECVQGWVSGYEVGQKDATLMAIVGSHKLHGAFEDFLNEKKATISADDWYKIEGDELQWFKDQKQCQVINIVCPPGSLVLWDSRVIHYGRQPIKGREKPRLRNVAYVCMTPRSWAKPKDLVKKIKIFEDGRMTTHVPHRPKMFGKSPRTYGHELKPIGTLEKPVLNSLGRRLVGYDY